MAFWQRSKTNSKAGFDKIYTLVDKLGPPVNRLSNKLGSEAFWPTTLDVESDKAARILKSFCKDGFYQEEDRPSSSGPNRNSKQRVLKTIPAEVIKNAKGLAIFTTMRTGLWVSGAGGSGVLVGRKEDGTWSPPSGIMLHTAGLGFLVGVDIYDCVVVINTQQALDAFATVRCTLGGEISAVAGPVGVGGLLETEVHKRQAPVFNYLKSRGFYAGVQIDGTIVIERTDENERFYGERIGVKDILAGNARHPPFEIRKLMETIKAAQGDSNIDESLLPSEPPPGDFDIQPEEDKSFGIPDTEDPDPYGVLALQNAGLEIREAGTHKRPTSEQFEFKPSPTSPIYGSFRKSFDRSSIDGRSFSWRSSWRTSAISSIAEPRTPTMVDMSTQTDLESPEPLKVPTLPSAQQSRPHTPSPSLPDIPEAKSTADTRPLSESLESTPENKDTVSTQPLSETLGHTSESKETDSTRPLSESRKDSVAHKQSRPSSPVRDSKAFDDVDLEDDADDGDFEEPVIQEIHQAAAPQAITRARLVQVAKPVPPKLPPRNPFRNRLSANSDVSTGDAKRDASAGPSLSPPSTPSLKNTGSSASSVSSVDGLEHVSNNLQPKLADESANKGSATEFHSLPESPVKAVPGSFD